MPQLALGLLQCLLGSLALRQIRALAERKSALCIGKRSNGSVRIEPLRGELVVRIVPTRFVWNNMGFVLPPLRFNDRVRSLTLTIEDIVGDLAFSHLAIIVCVALKSDGPAPSRCFFP
jgi:hypothetical protein